MNHALERMKAIISQVNAEMETRQLDDEQVRVRLVVYGTKVDGDSARTLYEEASQGTTAGRVKLDVHSGAQRFICWNCCGLRFEGDDGVCPNCGEESLELPDEIAFGIQDISIIEAP